VACAAGDVRTVGGWPVGRRSAGEGTVQVKDIPIEKIVVKKNVRTEPEQDLGGLMESIVRYGLIQPVLVVPRQNGMYELVAGHRRLAAMKALHEQTIPAEIDTDLSYGDVEYVKLIENIQRKDMSPLELVRAFDAMKVARPGLTMTAIGKLMGKSETWVADQYRIAQTYDELRAGGMTEQEIRALSKNELRELSYVKDKAARLDAAKEVRKEGRKAVGRPAGSLTKRGGFVDRSGGFAIMGTSDPNTIRVVCQSADARKDVLACLLSVKARRAKA
jgi:ParB/RepB/Spo0J family partition protein